MCPDLNTQHSDRELCSFHRSVDQFYQWPSTSLFYKHEPLQDHNQLHQPNQYNHSTPHREGGCLCLLLLHTLGIFLSCSSRREDHEQLCRGGNPLMGLRQQQECLGGSHRRIYRIYWALSNPGNFWVMKGNLNKSLLLSLCFQDNLTLWTRLLRPTRVQQLPRLQWGSSRQACVFLYRDFQRPLPISWILFRMRLLELSGDQLWPCKSLSGLSVSRWL